MEVLGQLPCPAPVVPAVGDNSGLAAAPSQLSCSGDCWPALGFLPPLPPVRTGRAWPALQLTPVLTAGLAPPWQPAFRAKCPLLRLPRLAFLEEQRGERI